MKSERFQNIIISNPANKNSFSTASTSAKTGLTERFAIKLNLQFSLVVLIVAALSVALKLFIAADVPASATFADDYNALNRARFFIEGVLHPNQLQYPSPLVPAGVAHHLLIAPWVFFDFPARLYFVFGVNAILSAIYVFAGSLTVWKLTGRTSLLVPIALSALTPTVIFNYYAMTENLVFPLIAILCYFVADIPSSLSENKKFALVVAVIALLPVTRTPGLSALGPIILVIWFHRSQLGLSAVILRIGWILSATIGVYFLYMMAMTSHREVKYSTQLSHLLSMSSSWPILGRLFLSQLSYVLVTTGGWILPLLLFFPLDPAWDKTSRQFRSTYLFGLLTSLCFVGFCLIHNLLKMHATGGDGWFIYGRYDDPANVLVTIVGFATLLQSAPLLWRTRILIGSVTFIATAVSLYYLADTKWVPINATGLSFFSVKQTSVTDYFLLAFTVASSAIWALPRCWKFGSAMLLIVFLVFNLASTYHGMIYTSQRAKGIAFATEGTTWLNANAQAGEVLCFDAAVTSQKAIGATKRLGNVYIAMMFNTYPLQTYMLRNIKELSRCSFIYSLKDRVPHFNLPVVWSNDGYAIIDARRSSSPVPGSITTERPVDEPDRLKNRQ